MQDKKRQSDLLTVQQAASFLNMSPGTIRRWAQTKKLNGVRVGSRGDWRFTEKNLLSMVRKSKEDSLSGNNATDFSYSALLDSISDAFIVFDSSWRYISVNTKGAALLGKKPEQVLGKRLLTVFPHAKDFPVYREMRRAMRTQTPMQFDYYTPRTDHWYMVRIYPSSATISIFFTDITDRKQVEEALKDANAFNQNILNSITDVFITYDKDWNFKFFNKQAQALIGIKDDTMIGKNAWKEFPSHVGTVMHKQFLASMKSQQPRSFEFFGGHTNRWYLCKTYPTKGGLTVYFTDITEHKAYEQRLQRSEEQYRLLVDLSPMPVAIHSEGKVVYANERAMKLMGAKKPSDILGRPVLDFVHSDYTEFVRNRVGEIYKKGKPHTDLAYEKFLKVDGTPIDVEVVSLRVLFEDKPAIQVVMRDITEEKVAQQKLHESEANFRTMFELSAIGQEQADPATGRFIRVNNKMALITGYSKEELLQKTFIEITHPDDREEDTAIFQQLLRGEIDSYDKEKRYVKKDGTVIWVHVTVTVIRDEHGKPIRSAGTVEDVTERRRLEGQKDEFIGIASHELKTPVTSLKAFAQVLERRFVKMGDEKSAALLSKMDSQLDKLTGLVSDLLDVTKIETGKLQFHEAYFDLNALIHEIVEEVQRTTEHHKIVMELARSKRLYGDRDRVGQVLMNLLTNAIKYSPKADRVIVTSHTNKHDVVVSVKDFGVGIKKDDQERIFDRFYRSHHEDYDTYPGMGLGLYISCEIVKRQGGDVTVKSTIGKGSTFSFTLPLRKSLRKSR